MSNGMLPHQGSMEKILKFSAIIQPKLTEWIQTMDANEIKTLSDSILEFERAFSEKAGSSFDKKAQSVLSWLDQFHSLIEKSGKANSTWVLFQNEVRQLCKTVPSGIGEKIAVMGSVTLLISVLLTQIRKDGQAAFKKAG